MNIFVNYKSNIEKWMGMNMCVRFWENKEHTPFVVVLTIVQALMFRTKKSKGKSSLTLVLASFFLDLTPKAQVAKAKIDKWDFINLHGLCAAKGTINKMKRPTTEWGKYFQILYLMGLISKMYK